MYAQIIGEYALGAKTPLLTQSIISLFTICGQKKDKK
jgi:hypothetical protein